MSELLFQKEFPLLGLNTLGVNAQAEYFASVATHEDIQQAIELAKEQQLAITVLGGGSNVLIAHHLSGLIIHPANQGIELLDTAADGNRLVKVAAGENWHQTVMTTLQNGWYGLENLALIPGNVGAAPIQNIGAYGVELKDVFHSLEAVDLKTGEQLSMSHDDCLFGYRDSIFKGDLKGQLLITSITLSLSSVPDINMSYPGLKVALDSIDSDITPESVAEAVIALRSSKLPDPEQLPNVGSFFKNPVVSSEKAADLRAEFSDLVSYPAAPGYEKLAAGWLIDRAGWKGKRVGRVGVHQHQALVLVNYEGASSAEVLQLAEQIKRDVVGFFGVELEREPEVLGLSV